MDYESICGSLQTVRAARMFYEYRKLDRLLERGKGLRETLQSLGVTEVMEAMDMDQFTNPQVRQAIGTLRREVQSIPGIRYYQCTWNPRFKGVDDYLLDWTKRKTA